LCLPEAWFKGAGKGNHPIQFFMQKKSIKHTKTEKEKVIAQ
jgi:hypothetical protein